MAAPIINGATTNWDNVQSNRVSGISPLQLTYFYFILLTNGDSEYPVKSWIKQGENTLTHIHHRVLIRGVANWIHAELSPIWHWIEGAPSRSRAADIHRFSRSTISKKELHDSWLRWLRPLASSLCLSHRCNDIFPCFLSTNFSISYTANFVTERQVFLDQNLRYKSPKQYSTYQRLSIKVLP